MLVIQSSVLQIYWKFWQNLVEPYISSHWKWTFQEAQFSTVVPSFSFSFTIDNWSLKRTDSVLFHQVFQKRLPPEAVDLVCRFFQYSPNLRCTAVCFHSLFPLPFIFPTLLHSPDSPFTRESSCSDFFLPSFDAVLVGSLHSSLLWWTEGSEHSPS